MIHNIHAFLSSEPTPGKTFVKLCVHGESETVSIIEEGKHIEGLRRRYSEPLNDYCYWVETHL
jgi:hypothetical protein